MGCSNSTSTHDIGGKNDGEISILLVGEAGCGKSTFINATYSYLSRDTLDDALNNDFNPPAPISFVHYADDDSEHEISFGHESKTEKLAGIFNSYVFELRGVNLRIIEAPGIGDDRSFEKDMKVFQNMIDCVRKFKHLDAICFLLKPNESRLKVQLRFCITELLRNLDESIRENIVFVMTYARTTFFRAGETCKLIQRITRDINQKEGLNLPFQSSNTFFFDNEIIRLLAVTKKGLHEDDTRKEDYYGSWNKSKEEYVRLIQLIGRRSTEKVPQKLSILDMERLIQKLMRPFANSMQLIEENIVLAENSKKGGETSLSDNKNNVKQYQPVIKWLDNSQTVCTSENCCQLIEDGHVKKIRRNRICHDQCFLTGTVKELIADNIFGSCEVMNQSNSTCRVCNCSSQKHQHIAYEYELVAQTVTSLPDIHRHIHDLQQELKKIDQTTERLNVFFQKNCFQSMNQVIANYLEYFLRISKSSPSANENQEIVVRLEQRVKTLLDKDANAKRKLEQYKNDPDAFEVLQPQQIVKLVNEIYDLPINGNFIRQQIENAGNSSNTLNIKEVVVNIRHSSSENSLVNAFLTEINSTSK